MMLKKALFIILTSLICLDTYSQDWVLRMDVSYQYLNVPQWDKAIQTYNLSRPNLTSKQPLLKHGYSIKLYAPKWGWDKPIIDYILIIHPTISYSNYRSTAQNENFKAQLNLDIIDVGADKGRNYSPIRMTMDDEKDRQNDGAMEMNKEDEQKVIDSCIKFLGRGGEFQGKFVQGK